MPPVDRPWDTSEHEICKIQEFLHRKALTYLEDPSVHVSQASSAVLRKALAGWMWLNNAEQMDEQRQTRLGTLGYLPVELRRDIWERLLGYHVSQAREAMSRRFLVRLGGSDYRFHEERRTVTDQQVLDVERVCWVSQPSHFLIGDVSSTIRNECDALIFSRLLFECLCTMKDFFAQLSAFQRSQVVSISFDIFAHCKYCTLRGREVTNVCLETFESLKRHLRNIEIGFGVNRGPAFAWRAREHRKLKSVHYKMWMLDQVLRQAKECAPDAVIRMRECNFTPGEHRDLFESRIQGFAK